MLILPPQISKQILEITPLLTTVVIAPHGITDLIHAEEHNKLIQLLRINVLSFASSIILHLIHLDVVTNFMFMTCSALHFRHDFPIKNNLMKILGSSLLVINTKIIGIELFILYMCFIHVPNHYRIYEYLIKENITKSFMYISLVAIVSTFLLFSDMSIMENENVYTISKALIISHIIYEEVYTKNNTKNIFTVLNNIIPFNTSTNQIT